MNNKLHFAAFAFSAVFFQQTAIANNEQCLLLGERPSFIVTSDGPLALATPQEKGQLLSQIYKKTRAHASAFTRIYRDTYLLKMDRHSIAQVTPDCYTKDKVNEVISDLLGMENIKSVYPNVLLRPQAVPQISEKQWSLESDMNAGERNGGMNAVNAWSLTEGEGVVAVDVDTGILENQSLTPNLLMNDAIHFTDEGSNIGVGAAPSCGSRCAGYDHGTHTAGTIAASGQYAYGEQIYGVAPKTKVIPINVFSEFSPSVCGGKACLLAYTSDILSGLAWVNGEYVDSKHQLPAPPKNIHAVNMSLGGFSGCYLQEVITDLTNHNIEVVVSAGNANQDAVNYAPANCKGTITVASVSRYGTRAYYSNYGKTVMIGAPGGAMGPQIDGIYSTVERGYGYMQGTSMAAPHVTGVVSLMYAYAIKHGEQLNHQQLLNILNSSAYSFGFSENPDYSCTGDKSCGSDVINAYAAVNAIANLPVGQVVWKCPAVARVGVKGTSDITRYGYRWDASIQSDHGASLLMANSYNPKVPVTFKGSFLYQDQVLRCEYNTSDTQCFPDGQCVNYGKLTTLNEKGWAALPGSDCHYQKLGGKGRCVGSHIETCAIVCRS